MKWMATNQRWCLQITIAACTAGMAMFGFSTSRGQMNSMAQAGQPVLAMGCPAKELSRSSPPFRCITPAIFRCLKRNNAAGGGSLEYRGNTNGDIIVRSNVAGTVAVLNFRFSEENQTLDLGVKKKNLPIANQQIWDGFKGTISKCRQNPNY